MDLSRYLNFRDKWQLLGDVSLWTISGICVLLIGKWIENCRSLQLLVSAPEPIRTGAFLFYLLIFFIFLKTLVKTVLDLRKKNKVYLFSASDWPNKWMFNGKTEPINNHDLFVKSSRAGCLIKDYLWKDFNMSFQVKFEVSKTRPHKNLGIAFRAEDLDNYFMIELIQENPFGNGQITGIGSQVRIGGGWEGVGIEELKFNCDDWSEISLDVKGALARLYINKKLAFNWILPTHVDVNLWEEGTQKSNSGNQNDLIKRTPSGITQKIPFRFNYGMVGFRAHMIQGAVVRGLKIKPI